MVVDGGQWNARIASPCIFSEPVGLLGDEDGKLDTGGGDHYSSEGGPGPAPGGRKEPRRCRFTV